MKNKVKVINKIDETDKEFDGRVNLFLGENSHAYVDSRFDDTVIIVYQDSELDPNPRWT